MEINRSILRQKKELLILIILSLSGILAIVWWMIFWWSQPSELWSSLWPNYFQDLTLSSTRSELSLPCQQVLTILDCITSHQQDSATILRYQQYLSERSLLTSQELEQQCQTTYRDITAISGSLPIDSLSCLQ